MNDPRVREIMYYADEFADAVMDATAMNTLGNGGKDDEAIDHRRASLEAAISTLIPTWIDWGDIDTFTSPVPEGTIVEIQIRCGEYRCGYSEDVNWEDDLGPWTVIRYRILGSRAA